MPPRFGGAPTCPRCNKAVYMAEQVIGPGGHWHRACLTCKECNKRLDSTTLTERDGEAYCRTCYTRQWGPKGYGFAGGAAFLSTESKLPSQILQPESRLENVSSSAFPSSPTVSTEINNKPAPPPLPVRPKEQPQSPATPTTSFWGRQSSEQPSSRDSSQSRPSEQQSEPPKSSYINYQTSYKPKKFGFTVQNDICSKCHKAVYAAELALGAGNKYHKSCLKCSQCGKLLDSTNMQDKGFDLYCRSCYSKSFGPKGFGYGNLLSPEGATR
ncbi:uncharacterized protein BYT42DRAFT_566714 [Radiomyces spectabilis]|uniref:uncharacterized protein n=1 Tax=Radiomyces spectabilis TaxID=64574 RepID=UPI00222048E7|nr:uncharacterized protein BYT42DRAFT_566714 [Radiomyces spectabilis]KAI8381492.1 hypothetical protein BYT42DRAFT_566714 [Radiomyces spectabilis]